jgi:NAD-dependent SIR2 family protein deacetylase
MSHMGLDCLMCADQTLDQAEDMAQQGTYKTVKARFWPWIEQFLRQIAFIVFKSFLFSQTLDQAEEHLRNGVDCLICALTVLYVP